MNSTIKKLIRKLKMYNNKKNLVHSVEPLSLSLSQYLLFISSQVIHHYLYGKKKKRPIIICVPSLIWIFRLIEKGSSSSSNTFGLL